MALESFGTETAVMIDRATVLCHDLLLNHKKFNSDEKAVENVARDFRAGEDGIWQVYPALVNDAAVVIIELGVG